MENFLFVHENQVTYFSAANLKHAFERQNPEKYPDNGNLQLIVMNGTIFNYWFLNNPSAWLLW